MCCEAFEVVSFDLLQGQMGSLTFYVNFSRLLLVLDVWDVVEMLLEMCCESFRVVRLDLGPLLQGQRGSLTFKVDFFRFLLLLVVLDVHPAYSKRCAASLLEWSDFICDSPLKLLFLFIICSRGLPFFHIL